MGRIDEEAKGVDEVVPYSMHVRLRRGRSKVRTPLGKTALIVVHRCRPNTSS